LKMKWRMDKKPEYLAEKVEPMNGAIEDFE
jgi:hypothetical protein